MENERLEPLIKDIKNYVTGNLNLSQLSDEELKEKIEEIVIDKNRSIYLTNDNKIYIVKQIFSSIRGLDILDIILDDDEITEIMINGPDKIFVEKKGQLQKLNKKFESERRLEDIIHRIVSSAGREVNYANPIVDTRLKDARVNVVLSPISLVGPVMTIRKFSKTPMTIEQLIKYGSINEEVAEKLELLVKAK